MEGLSRQEYPAMLERLQPTAAVSKLNERVKKIGRINAEIADWLQERRKVEEAYIAGLKRLSKKPLQDVGGDLGILEGPWRRVLSSTETLASSHATFSQGIEKDVEQPLRGFSSNNREMSAMTTIQGNLASMAKEIEDAQDKSDKLTKKGGKASTQKVESAASKLQSAHQQWDSQAPFIFETLQSLDETRLNHLRDVLTQYETHEADQIERNRISVEQTLSSLLEIDTSEEIKNWALASTAGKPITERKGRQQSTAGSSVVSGNATGQTPSLPAPPTPRSIHTDNASEHSGRQESFKQENSGGTESKLKSRFGTMLGRRRQSMHGGFARAPSPSKASFSPFGRNAVSRDGRPNPSPRASSNNLRESPAIDNRLSSLVESPTNIASPNGNTFSANPDPISVTVPERTTSVGPNGTTGLGLTGVPEGSAPPASPPTNKLSENRKDSEGFSVPGNMDDPISQAQQEAANDGEQPQFKLDIRNEPIPEQDADAQAALSNVANTLRSAQAVTPSRKVGTVRGRRDVRNTMYVSPSTSLDVFPTDAPHPPSPGVAAGRAAALATLSSSEPGPSNTSDTTSIRSGHSFLNTVTPKHAEMHQPGMNASIIETVSATIENGAIKAVKIGGEIALVYNKIEADELPAANETIRINNFPNLEAIGPNRTFIHPLSDERPDEFTVDMAPILSRSAIAFTYRVHVEDSSLASKGPLLLRPAWKPQGDKLGLVLEYSLNPAYGYDPVNFSNLILVAFYGGKAVSCQTKPTGTHLKEKSYVFWRLGDVSLSNEWQKVVCRLVGLEGSTPEPDRVEARWEVPGSSAGISLSRLEAVNGKEKEESVDPFADEDAASPATVSPTKNWHEIELARKLVSGKYEARQVTV